MTTPGAVTVELGVGADWLRLDVGGRLLTSEQLGPVTITRGRREQGKPFEPATCTLTVSRADLEAAGTAAGLGATLPRLRAPLRLDLSPAAVAVLGAGWDSERAGNLGRRFVGEVSDLDLRLAPTTDRQLVSITATSPLAAERRHLSTHAGGFQLLEGEYARQLLAAAVSGAGFVVDPFPVSDAGVSLLPPDTRGQETGKLLDELSAQTRGLLLERRDAGVFWHEADWRLLTPVDANGLSTRTPRAVVALDDQLSGGASSMSWEDVANDVTVIYGADLANRERRQNTDSQNLYGRRPLEVRAPLLLSFGAAGELADWLLKLYATPRWSAPRVDVDVLRTAGTSTAWGTASWQQLTGSWADAVGSWAPHAGMYLALELDDHLRVNGGPRVLAPDWLFWADCWLEGYTEQLTRDSWRLALTVSRPDVQRPKRRVT